MKSFNKFNFQNLETVNIKMLIRVRASITFMVLSALLLFTVSACTPKGSKADLNLTYIGEAVGPNERLTYFLQGPAQGETVVLLPGMGRGACEFREIATSLNKAGYRTVAIQPRGIGRSGPILTEPSYEQFAEDVAIVLRDIPGGIQGEKAHLLGYEFGNRIVREFAVKYPEHVQSLILLACGGQEVSPTGSTTENSKSTQGDTGTSMSSSLGQNPDTPAKKVSSVKASVPPCSDITMKIDSFFCDLTTNTMKTDSQHVTISGMTAAFAFWLPPSKRESLVKNAFFSPMSKVPYYWITGWYRDTGWMQEQMDVDHSSTSADWVSGGNAPMLILQGQYDVAAPVENGVYMENEYPDRVTLVVVPDAGHAMLAEQPAFILEHVVSYLDQHPIVR